MEVRCLQRRAGGRRPSGWPIFSLSGMATSNFPFSNISQCIANDVPLPWNNWDICLHEDIVTDWHHIHFLRKVGDFSFRWCYFYLAKSCFFSIFRVNGWVGTPSILIDIRSCVASRNRIFLSIFISVSLVFYPDLGRPVSFAQWTGRTEKSNLLTLPNRWRGTLFFFTFSSISPIARIVFFFRC